MMFLSETESSVGAKMSPSHWHDYPAQCSLFGSFINKTSKSKSLLQNSARKKHWHVECKNPFL